MSSLASLVPVDLFGKEGYSLFLAFSNSALLKEAIEAVVEFAENSPSGSEDWEI